MAAITSEELPSNNNILVHGIAVVSGSRGSSSSTSCGSGSSSANSSSAQLGWPILEVMSSRPRSDMVVNLSALQKLDNMLLEILEGFTETEFWYVDQGVIAPETDGSGSFREAIHLQEDKWWLHVPRVLLAVFMRPRRSN